MDVHECFIENIDVHLLFIDFLAKNRLWSSVVVCGLFGSAGISESGGPAVAKAKRKSNNNCWGTLKPWEALRFPTLPLAFALPGAHQA